MIYKLDNIVVTAELLIEKCKEYSIWLFEGEMGAGKTTLIKAVCDYWKVNDNVSSPTFGIVNEYDSEDVGVLYHFDFYRFEREKEALDIGVEDYFYSGDYCFVEWSSKIESFIPEKHVVINITVKDEKTRQIDLQYHG